MRRMWSRKDSCHTCDSGYANPLFKVKSFN